MFLGIAIAVFLVAGAASLPEGERPFRAAPDTINWTEVAEQAARQTDMNLGLDRKPWPKALNYDPMEGIYYNYDHPYRDVGVEYGTLCDPLFEHYQYVHARARAYFDAAEWFGLRAKHHGGTIHTGRAGAYRYDAVKYQRKAMDLLFQYTACRFENPDH